jgi:hypothetical protein
LTNTSSPLFQNLSRGILPNTFERAPLLLLNNPIALQKRYLKLKDDPNVRSQQAYFREAVMASEQEALEMLVGLFEWLDGLEPQPTSKIVSGHDALERRIDKVTGPLDRQAKKVQGALKDKVEAGVRRVNRFLIDM